MGQSLIIGGDGSDTISSVGSVLSIVIGDYGNIQSIASSSTWNAVTTLPTSAITTRALPSLSGHTHQAFKGTDNWVAFGGIQCWLYSFGW